MNADLIAKRAAHRSYLPAGWDREDLEQEVRIGLWRAGDIDDALANTVARRRCIDAVRGAQPGIRGDYAPKDPISLETPINSGAEEVLTLGDTLTDPIGLDTSRIDVEVALRRLEPRTRVVILALMEGERANEVAERIGVTPGRISQLLAIARERLRPWADLQDAA